MGSGTVDVTIELLPTPELGPGQVGEGLNGGLVINLYRPDGTLEVSEPGSVTMSRVEPLDDI